MSRESRLFLPQLTEIQKQNLISLVRSFIERRKTNPTQFGDLKPGNVVINLAPFGFGILENPDIYRLGDGDLDHVSIGVVATITNDQARGQKFITVKTKPGLGRDQYYPPPSEVNPLMNLVILTDEEIELLRNCGYYIPTLTD